MTDENEVTKSRNGPLTSKALAGRQQNLDVQSAKTNKCTHMLSVKYEMIQYCIESIPRLCEL